jgi:hypothetical protein
MGHREDFYIEQNIIGYTNSSALFTFPSIYFYNCHRKLFGHFTQQHENPANIGKTLVVRDHNYLIFNSGEGDPALQTSRILGTATINISIECLVEIAHTKQGLSTGENIMIECFNSHVFHVSRSEFIPIKKGDNDKRSTLAAMIKNQSLLKLKYNIKDIIDDH